MKRRTMLKSLGAISLGVSASTIAKGEALADSFKTSKQDLDADIVVVGGGTAGHVAAIQAARLGSKTILIESGSQLGGTMTTGGVAFPGIFHAWGKQVIGGVGWELVSECVELNGDQLPDFSIVPDNKAIRHWRHQVAINSGLYTLMAEEKCIEAGVEIRYYETPSQLKFENGKWKLTSIGKGTEASITCNQIIDCTGNALITSMVGYNVLREEVVQPGSLIYTLEGYDNTKLDYEAIPSKYHKALNQNMFVYDSKNNFPSTVPYNYVYVSGADSTNSQSHSKANLDGRKSLLKLIRELKQQPGCENIRLASLQTETAIRETFRIDAMYQVTKDDYLSGKKFEDTISHSFYPVDLHQDGKKIHQEFLEPGVVGHIPLRALIPKNSQNLLVAGRCVGSDRMANSALRVQASCMGMGQAAAVAAHLAKQNNTTPAEVPIEDIQTTIKDNGGIIT